MGQIIDMTGWIMSEHGIPDSRIKIIKRVENTKSREAKWLCECLCEQHNQFVATGGNIRSGNTKSCGCIHNEILVDFNKITKKKINKYDLSGEYGIGWTSNTNEEFYFDLEDFDKIKDICWYAHKVNSNGYIRIYGENCKTHKQVSMAQVICGDWMDHIDRNTFDNRKTNLRPCTPLGNSQNKSIQRNNISGISGVTWEEDRQKWKAFIKVNKKDKRLGNFINKEDAIKARLEAEAKYYGEFAPQKHLFEEYGVK